jgi:hypothetical protein
VIKKDRHEKLMAKINNDIKIIDKIIIDDTGIHVIDIENNKDATTAVDYQVSYKRICKKDKILNTLIDIDLSSNDLFAKYQIVCACDTNTTNENDGDFSTSAFLMGKIISIKESEIKREFTMQCINWESTGIGKPENYAWTILISGLNDLFNNLNINPKVLLIVDSDLENHEAFNKREMALIGDFFLPPNYTIVYASADVGAEYPTNQLIRLCDKEASKYHKEILKSKNN